MSEESDELAKQVRTQADCYWLIDPLDGTKGVYSSQRQVR